MSVLYTLDGDVRDVPDFSSSRTRDFYLAKDLVKALELAVVRSQKPDIAKNNTITSNLTSYLTHALDIANIRQREYISALRRDIANTSITSQSRPVSLNNVNAHNLDKAEIFRGINFQFLASRLTALQSNIPDASKTQEAHLKFAKELAQTCFRAFNLSNNLLRISQKEAKIIEDYLYINSLMVKCKRAAVRVSPDTWQKIERAMLLDSR